MRNITLPAFCAALTLTVGCAQYSAPVETSDSLTSTPATGAQNSEASKMANRNCPIMGHSVASDGGTSSWNGKTIGYCCEGCKPKFDALSDEEKVAKLAKADNADHSGHDDVQSSDGSTTEETES